MDIYVQSPFSPQRPYTVTELVEAINVAVKDLPEILVEGEIGSFTHHRSGHWYFSLKDVKSRVDCTMWANVNRYVRFEPEVGQKVRIRGELDFYGPFGKLSLIARTIEPSGEGELLALFLALKRRLEEEGLFRPEIKRPIPRAPRAIGIISGANTAALKDALNRLKAQAPYAAITVYPALVQGVQAVADIIRAMNLAQVENRVEVLLLIRGGGSLEDLWCFNDETLARAIRACVIPVVSGIGHSTDETIADYVADLWCQTPTQAANAVGTDRRTLLSEISGFMRIITHSVEALISESENNVGNASYVFGNPASIFSDREKDLHRIYDKFSADTKNRMGTFQNSVILTVHSFRYSIKLDNLEHNLKGLVWEITNQTGQYIHSLQFHVTQAAPSSGVSVQLQQNRVSEAFNSLQNNFRNYLRLKGSSLEAGSQALQANGTNMLRDFQQKAQFQLVSPYELLDPYQKSLHSHVQTFRLCRPKPQETKLRDAAALLANKGVVSITLKENDLLKVESKFSRFGSKKIMEMGYAQVRNEKGFVLSINDVTVGKDVTVRLSDGSFVAQVKTVKPEDSRP